MTAGLRKNFMGKYIIVNLFTKHGYRLSPGINARAHAVAACARGKSLPERKKCFASGGR